ncbi:RluA family pseudouridine synthase [bacterium]|nr:RluA family pseudouridine synthase [bacterium]
MRKHARPGDKVLDAGLEILHEDRDIIVVNKPAGLLTIATERDRERTAYFILMDYVRKGAAKSPNRVYVVHRIDKGTSGVLIFAKTEAAKMQLQDHWSEIRKKYLTVVHGKLEKKSDLITSYLAENSVYHVYSTPDSSRGKLAKTAYRVIKETKIYSVLEVDLLTGRKHQIRVHLAGIGHPVVGDRKYGPKEDKNKELALHARSISFRHPYSGKEMTFEAPVPEYFKELVGEISLGEKL